MSPFAPLFCSAHFDFGVCGIFIEDFFFFLWTFMFSWLIYSCILGRQDWKQSSGSMNSDPYYFKQLCHEIPLKY